MLGNSVRYDGGHKYDVFINATFGKYFEFVPYCPEVAIGLGIPRNPMQLIIENDECRVVGVKNTKQDFTQSLHDYGKSEALNLGWMCGFIFKSGSPSCGPNQVTVLHDTSIKNEGIGAFAYEILRGRPELPVEDELRLKDINVGENFIQRVLVLQRWNAMLMSGQSCQKLVDFHRKHKYLILIHDECGFSELEKMVNEVEIDNLDLVCTHYVVKLMQILTLFSTSTDKIRVLTQLVKVIENRLNWRDKHKIEELIENCRRGRDSVMSAITLIKQFADMFPDKSLSDQVFLNPHPMLMPFYRFYDSNEDPSFIGTI